MLMAAWNYVKVWVKCHFGCLQDGTLGSIICPEVCDVFQPELDEISILREVEES